MLLVVELRLFTSQKLDISSFKRLSKAEPAARCTWYSRVISQVHVLDPILMYSKSFHSNLHSFLFSKVLIITILVQPCFSVSVSQSLYPAGIFI